MNDSNDDSSTRDAEKPDESNETVAQDKRQDMLEQYSHRCQGCGRCGPGAGGLATLQIHHIERNPDGMDEHDPANLTVLCQSCHTWLHQQATPNDSPIEITAADESVLLSQDISILRTLAEQGPARTGDIAAEVPGNLAVTSVRERLWVLMGLDNRVERRDDQIIDKDIETGEWGLVEQIENSARGHIPNDSQVLAQRIEDEQVRQALERGVDRSTVTTVFDVSRRTTFNKEKRALAFDFPLEAFRSRGGRPTANSAADQNESPSNVSVETGEEATGAEQQRLDTDADQQQSPEQPHSPGSTASSVDVRSAQDVDENEESAEETSVGSDDSDGRDQVVIDMAGDEADIREQLRKLLNTLNDGGAPA